MKLIVSGKTKDFTPDIQERFSAKLAKLSKLIERRGEREAHVSHQTERHLHKIDLVMNLYDHQVAVHGEHADLDIALSDAATKLEKQVVKMRTKWRSNSRSPKVGRAPHKEAWDTPAAVPVAEAPKAKVNGKALKPAAKSAKAKIFHVNYDEDSKPMTIEEAMLEMEAGHAYTVFRNAKANSLSVLVRREDGNFDLIES